MCDEVWLVVCDSAAQRARLAARGADADDAEARIAAQADMVERLAPAATRVLDTTGSLETVHERVLAAFREAAASR